MPLITIRPKNPAELASIAKASATKRIAEIRLDMIDKFSAVANGTPAEQAAANAAIGQLRAEMALEKAKL